MSVRLEIIPPSMDWTQIMVDLNDHGCTIYRVYTTLGVSESAARNWVKGGEPCYSYGRALLRLHSRYCGAGLTVLRMEQAEQVAPSV